MATKHSPEPWAVYPEVGLCEARAKDVNYKSYIIWDGADGPYPKDEDVERIVACVNACAGINPEAVPDLLAACKVALGLHEHGRIKIEYHQADKQIRAAIAKAVPA